jgi:hypothetical protein
MAAMVEIALKPSGETMNNRRTWLSVAILSAIFNERERPNRNR